MTAFTLSPLTRTWTAPAALVLESGARLESWSLAYRTWGRLSESADNAVVLCHALTGSADADDWWAPLFGPGRALDPGRDFIVCSNVLGGCYGSSGPVSTAPDGRPWGRRFPTPTLRDQVRAQIALADALGIRGIRLAIGGSMGGMQALEWALLDPARVRAVAAIAAGARSSAWALAWSAAQRLALAGDPRFADGDYDPGDPPVAGLAAARAIAMVTYRSAASLARRFSDAAGVEAWLAAHGERLVARFDANTYRLLVGALDSHDLGRGRGSLASALRALAQPCLVVSIPTDALYPPEEQARLVEGLPNATPARLDSVHGHDGFLIDAAALEAQVREFRARTEDAGQAMPRRAARRWSAAPLWLPPPS